MVKNRLPKLCAGLAWIWLPVMVLSDGVGWNGELAAGWPAVVVLGVAGRSWVSAWGLAAGVS